MDPQNAPGAPINANFRFWARKKMNHHFSIELHDESNGNSLKAQKINHDTLIALIGPTNPKYGIFQLWAMTKMGIIFV